jgi:O-antigen ligase
MIRWLIPVALFIALSQTGIGIISWFEPRALPAKWVDYDHHRTIGTMVNTNAYVTTLILVGFLFLHYGMQSSSNRVRLVSIFVFLLTLYGIFISFSRAGWLAGILALVGLTAIYPKFILKLGLTIVPIFLLVSASFLQNQMAWAGQRLISDESEQSAFSRVPVYAAAIRMFQSKPFFGWGYGNFDRFDRRFQVPTVANISGDNKDHASHNFFLSMIAEQGLVGILLYLAPVFYWLRLTIKHFSKLPRDGFWSRKILVIFWMTLLSHIIVYNFANMRVIFGLGAWWLTLGLIARFMDFHRPILEQSSVMATALQQMRFIPRKQERT